MGAVGDWESDIGWELELGNSDVGGWRLGIDAGVGPWDLEVGIWELEVGSWELGGGWSPYSRTPGPLRAPALPRSRPIVPSSVELLRIQLASIGDQLVRNDVDLERHRLVRVEP